MTKVKICGLRTRSAIDAALAGGADYLGLVFYPPSPRNVSIDEGAELAAYARAHGKARIVALTVDADDRLIATIAQRVQPDFFQLHGSETPQRAKAIRQLAGTPVIKAIKVKSGDDVAGANAYKDSAEMILFDAKAPADLANALPGGNGLAFDWNLIGKGGVKTAFMLSGGLDADNVGTALAITRAPIVDVSSGVESRPGVKDAKRISRFLATARGHANASK